MVPGSVRETYIQGHLRMSRVERGLVSSLNEVPRRGTLRHVGPDVPGRVGSSPGPPPRSWRPPADPTAGREQVVPEHPFPGWGRPEGVTLTERRDGVSEGPYKPRPP